MCVKAVWLKLKNGKYSLGRERLSPWYDVDCECVFVLCRRHFDKSRFCRPKARIANPQISRGSGAQRPGYRPTRVLHAAVPSSSGPVRKHTANFEPAAWSWAQMTSGSGAPKNALVILSEKAITFKRLRPN